MWLGVLDKSVVGFLVFILVFPLFYYGRDYLIELNIFLIPINMSTFYFIFSKIFLQLLVLKKNFIFIFGPSFKVNSYVEFLFLNKILQKIYNIIIISQKKIEIFNLT